MDVAACILRRMASPSMLVVGAGRLGTALALGLARGGWRVAAYARGARGRAALRRRGIASGRLADAGRFDLVFLAVPDEQVEPAARSVAPHLRRGQVVAHGSGALPLAPLAIVRARGAHAGSLHPMQALAGGPLAAGVTAALDGDRPALRLLSRAARDLRLSPVRVPERGRAQYHAASAIAANLCMALADLAAETWVAAGAPRRRAIPAIVPLLRGAVENLAARGLPEALTGPVSRGDAQTVERHLRALDGPDAEVYRLLSLRLVRVARQGGLGPRKAAAVRRALRRSDDALVAPRRIREAPGARPRPRARPPGRGRRGARHRRSTARARR